jgi:hypothetical protein
MDDKRSRRKRLQKCESQDGTSSQAIRFRLSRFTTHGSQGKSNARSIPLLTISGVQGNCRESNDVDK